MEETTRRLNECVVDHARKDTKSHVRNCLNSDHETVDIESFKN